MSNSRVSLLSPFISTSGSPWLSNHDHTAFQLAAPLWCCRLFSLIAQRKVSQNQGIIWAGSFNPAPHHWVSRQVSSPLAPQPCPPRGCVKIPHGIFSSLNLTRRARVLTLREDCVSVSIPSSSPVMSGVGFNLFYFPAFFFVCTNLLQGNELALSTGRRYVSTIRDKRASYWWHSRKHNHWHLCISSFMPRARRHCQGPGWTLSTQWVHMASEGCWTGAYLQLYYFSKY